MANVSTAYKRLFVRYLLHNATGANTILSLLQTAMEARIEATETGRVLVTTSGNGHQSGFHVPSDFNATDAADLISEMFDRYYEAKERLQNDGTSSPTDTQIHNEMLRRLRKIDSVTYDFSGLRTDREEESTSE